MLDPNLSDSELNELIYEARAELERRRELAALRLEIETLSGKYARAEAAGRVEPVLSTVPVEAAARGVGIAQEKVARALAPDGDLVTEVEILPTAEPQ